MSGIAQKIAKPAGEILAYVAKKIPQAMAKAHHRIGQMAHDAADHFDKVEEDLAGKARIHSPHGDGDHEPHFGEPGGGNHGGRGDHGDHSDEDGGGNHNLRDGDPDKNSVPKDETVCKSDPVDVATGEMVLRQVDVCLPGGLPLVVERTHASSFRHGLWFGRSWSSTLDQRLQLDVDGVVFVAADGMRLTYPVPRAGGEVLPVKGPRRPLYWSGEPDTPMRVSDPKTGETLVFDHPRPTPGVGVALRLAAVEDRSGRRIGITWADDDTPALITHHGGYRVAVDRHPGLRRVTGFRLLDAEGPGTDALLMRFGYDGTGNLTEVVDSSGLPLRFTYDAESRITGWTDRNGTEYAYEYDDAGRVVRTTGSDGFLSGAFEYDETSRTTTFTDSLDHASTYLHNEFYRLIRETDPLGNSTVREWDNNNRLVTAVTDALGRTTRYDYDDAENLVAVHYADGSTVRASYNGFGQPVEVTDAGGALWRQSYDERGLPTAFVDPLGAETRYVHDENGDLTRVTDALGSTTSFSRNAAGIPVETTDPLGATTRQSVNAFGRVGTVTDPLGGVTRLEWSVDGRLTARTDPDGTVRTWSYNGEGALVGHVDALGQESRFEYNPFDRISARTGPDGIRYEFAYDTELRLTGVTDPGGARWEYTFDAAGRLVGETDFNGRDVRYEFDAVGQLLSRTNGAGQTSSYRYDQVGRLIGRHTLEGDADFGYDAGGRLLRAANGDCEIRFAYDAAGRPLSETCDDLLLAHTYDLLGRRVTRRTPSGAETSWSYDAGHRPTGLRTAAGMVDFAYDSAGREIRRGMGAAVLTQDWGPNHRLLAQTVTRTPRAPGPRTAETGLTPEPVQRRTYAYRADGHVSGVDDLLRGRREFQLDPTGRITGAGDSGRSESYGYDRVGNLERASWAESADNALSSGSEHTGTLLRRAGRTRYEYDGQGRVVRRVRKLLSGGIHVWRFSWDSEDRLVQATTPDGAVWKYRYDALGRRIAKQRLGNDGTVVEQTVFVWDGTVVAEQRHSSPGGEDRTRITTWEWDPDDYRPLTQTDITISAHDASQEEIDRRFYTIVGDLVGTPSEILDENGEIAWRSRADVWGTSPLEPSADDAAFPLRFPGQYLDRETGLHYNVFRYYDPSTARYYSPDPLGLTPAPNHHTYVRNPLTWSDPLGLGPCQDEGLDPSQNHTHGHIADVVITGTDGSVRTSYGLFSGRTTPAESTLGTGYNAQAVTHTEHRVSRMSGASTGPSISIPNDPYHNLVPMHPGETATIYAVLEPCKRCRGAMNRMHRELGVNVTYHWDGPDGAGTWTAGRRRR